MMAMLVAAARPRRPDGDARGARSALAILHQLGAVALFTLIVRARFAALYPRAQRIARG